jgi:hypothetical protein
MNRGPIMIWRSEQDVVDDAVFAFVQWREERARVWDAYAQWTGRHGQDIACVYAAYRAALDGEEAAANAYAKVMDRLRELLATGQDYPPNEGSER